MYVDISKTKNKSGSKTYTRALLRESYREDGKVKHRTIANISHLPKNEIAAIRLALRHKEQLDKIASIKKDISSNQGLSVGGVYTVFQTAKKLGIVQALGNSKDGKLALWQVISRVLEQGSRLSAVRLAKSHAACEILGLPNFNEDDLYKNLDWLCSNQQSIEDKLFAFRNQASRDKAGLFLYDVTSSYLEGQENELSAFGYNRDQKRGKKQIVIGLLCDGAGTPLSIEVFPGNTSDTATFSSQIAKASQRFGSASITLVGDRGMIKGPQRQSLQLENESADSEQNFHYITAISKPQIQSLLNKGMLQLSLFDTELCEVCGDEQRYILRKNPQRAQQIADSRTSKFASVQKFVAQKNRYLQEHLKASLEVAHRDSKNKANSLNISDWAIIKSDPVARQLHLSIDENALQDASKLDGCYVIITDLPQSRASKEVVHARYKDLSQVEWAFRTSKTSHLELRPIFLRNGNRTKGHALVVMLAYIIVKRLKEQWKDFDSTVAENLHELCQICSMEVIVKKSAPVNYIPNPRPFLQELLSAAQIILPKAIPHSSIVVSTKKKLTSRRK